MTHLDKLRLAITRQGEQKRRKALTGDEKYFIPPAPWLACHCARIAFPSEELSWV